MDVKTVTNSANRRFLTQAGSLFLLLFAILPSITFVGHGSLDAGHRQAHTHSHVHVHSGAPLEQDDGDHASHCHEGLSKCGGQQSLVGTWWVGEDNGDLVLDDPLRPIANSTEAQHSLDPLTKILQPPRSSV